MLSAAKTLIAMLVLFVFGICVFAWIVAPLVASALLCPVFNGTGIAAWVGASLWLFFWICYFLGGQEREVPWLARVVDWGFRG